MITKKNGFWEYFEKWKYLFEENRFLKWNINWLENDFCKDCRYCCGPQDSADPFPMALLPAQLKPNIQKFFHMLNENTAYLGADGCKSHSETGCKLSETEKPVACGIFPIVLINGNLYLYQNCPAAIAIPLAQFAPFAMSVAKMLYAFSFEELKHISISLPCEVLAKKYIDLHITLFDGEGKKLILS